MPAKYTLGQKKDSYNLYKRCVDRTFSDKYSPKPAG